MSADTVCKCGHPARDHYLDQTIGELAKVFCRWSCSCRKFEARIAERERELGLS